MLMAPAPVYDRLVESAPHARARESALDHSELRMLRAKRRLDIGLALRPARFGDGDPLQSYVRGFLRSRVTIGSWAPQTNSRRRNWRAHWPPMVVTP